MKTLVTGATGLIGGHVARLLVERGDDVRVLVREGSDTRGIEGLDVEGVTGDLRDRDSLVRALDGCGILYQVAAAFSFKMDAGPMRATNVTGTQNILEAALARGVDKVVYTSTTAAVASGTPDRPATEESPYDLEGMGSYFETKKAGEIEALEFAARGLPVVLVNPGYVIGPGDWKPTPGGEIIIRYLNRRIPMLIDSGLSLVHAEDVARGHLLAAEKGKPGERYILAGENLSIRAFFMLIEEIGGIRMPKIRMPVSLGLGFAYPTEFLFKRLGRTPPVTVDEARMASKSYCFDSAKAARELGYSFRSARETLAETVRWFREAGYL